MEQPVAKTPRPSMLTADEVAERLKIKKGSAYEVIRQMNKEQEALGRVVIRGRVRRALFEARDDVERENRKDRAVHGHRNRYLRKRDFVEQHLHVHDGVYRDARLADVADDARVVGVVAAVRGQVERD